MFGFVDFQGKRRGKQEVNEALPDAKLQKWWAFQFFQTVVYGL